MSRRDVGGRDGWAVCLAAAVRRLAVERLEDRRVLSEIPFPVPLGAVEPLGSLIYEGSATGDIAAADETDSFTIDLDDGQTVTLLVDPDATLTPKVELYDTDNTLIGSATAGSPGVEAVVQAVATTGAGTYTLKVDGELETTGAYTVRLILNAALEEESHGGPANDEMASAQDLNTSFISLAAGPASRGAVLGTVTGNEDWYRFTLDDGQSATLALAGLIDGAVLLDLYDAGATRLAAGAAAENLASVIGNFVDSTGDGGLDTYYARIRSASGIDYSLIVTRSADFDVEPGSSRAQTQQIMPSGVVLGHSSALSNEQQQKLTASDAASEDWFGRCVSIDENTAMVGAPDDDHAGLESGSAYVFRFDGSQWVEQQKLTAHDAANGDWFGCCVSIDGNTAIVGAYQNNEAGLQSGSAYVFRFDGSQWVEQQKLTASDAAEDDYFGYSVAIDGETAIVGAYGNDDAGSLSGSAYVFRFDGSQWVQQQKLTASDAAEYDQFGLSVAIDGETAIVGAYGNSDAGSYSGSAYVFRFDADQWVQQQKLTASDAANGDHFGYSVSIDGNTAIVGAYRNHDAGSQSGSAYVFRFNGRRWVQQQKLVASDADADDLFGYCVSISGGTAVVGACGDDDGGWESGSAYVFYFNGARWIEEQKLTADDADRVDRFGGSVSINGNGAIVGAHLNDDAGSQSGSAYVFQLHPDEYLFGAQAGDTLVVNTETPNDGPGEFVNELDPMIELFDPAGVLVAADDNGAADGRNALLTHDAAATGMYRARLSPAGNTSGEFLLSVAGYSGALPAFEVFGTDLADGTQLGSPPVQITVDFNDAVRLDSLQPADMTVDEVPAVDMTVVDGDTVTFDLPDALPDGVNHVAIADGAILDLQGTPIEPFASTFLLDTSPPYVVASSIDEGETVPVSALVYTAAFNEPLDDTNLDPSDVALVGEFSGAHTCDMLDYDPTGSTLTLQFGNLPEDAYSLTLRSGDGRFEDLMGHDLDGSPSFPLPSGDGIGGDDFVVNFVVHDLQVAYPVPLEAMAPLGSLIYQGSANELIPESGCSDALSIDLDDGQTIAVVVEPDVTLMPKVELFDPGNDLIGTATAASPGEEAVIQAVATTGAGTYTLKVDGELETIGAYTVRLILNAGLEEESHGGPGNHELASAEDFDASFISLPAGSAERGAVLGSFGREPVGPGTGEELIVNGGFESGDFTGWTASTNGLGELTPWTVGPSGGGFFFNSSPYEGTYSAYNGFDGEAGLQYELCQTVTIPVTVAATLTTHHRIVYAGGAADPQDRILQISIRDTYGNVLEVLSTQQITPVIGPETDLGWHELSFDLAEYAGRTVEIHFLELIPETHTGPAMIEFDQISLIATEPRFDWYRFTLGDGQSATLALTALTPGRLLLDLYDAEGTRLATGMPADNVDRVISNFVDTTTDEARDTYHARVMGIAGTEYSLLITRNAEFDLEASGSQARAQQIMPSGVVLGHSSWISNVPAQKLTASDAASGDEFGRCVSISGDTALVGAPYDNDAGLDSGSAYVFQFDAAQWVEQQKLTASDAAHDDQFGYSVSIDGDTAIVGAYGNDDAGSQSGSAYVFRFDGSRWVEQQKLTASDAADGHYFGYCVSIDGDTAIVGAWGNDDAGWRSGSAYVFRFDGNQWVEQQKLVASDADSDDWFGHCVWISGGTALVGAPCDDDSGSDSGSAYVFRFDGNQWVEQQKLSASDAADSDRFGYSVSIDGNTGLVGSGRDDHAAVDAGSAYVFHFDGSQWVEQQKLTAHDAGEYDYFGYSVSIEGHTAIVGAWGNDDAGSDSGSAYVFRFDGSQWIEQEKLTADDADSEDWFGYSVSIDRGTAIVGAYGNDDAGSRSGSAYVFQPHPDDYLFGVQAGDTLVINTETPSDGPGEFVNELDPMIELYDPAGTLVAADDNGAANGRNALLTHDAAATGMYRVRLSAAANTSGEFLLSVAGNSGVLPAFAVQRTDPEDGAQVTSAVQIRVDFNDPVLLSSLEAADLSLDGVPVVEVHLLDGNTAVFDLPTALSEGVHQVAIAAGAILDLQGTPIEPYAGTFTIDTIPPRVIASSVEEGQTVPVGTLVYTAQFDEPLDATSLDPSDIALVGQFSGGHTPDTFEYDPMGSTLTLQFADLPEDAYLLTLRSGDGRFEDLVGHDLDGSPSFPLPSGDGVGGDDFVVSFVVHDPQVACPVPLEATRPRGSLIYRRSIAELIPAPGRSDSISIDLDDGQTITVVVDPDATLRPTIELLDPGDVLIGAGAANTPGTDAVLQVAPTSGPGTYMVVVAGASDTVGAYTAELILNAAVEDESHDGPSNDDAASAEDLDRSLIALADGPAQRGAVLGSLTSSADWYRFTLEDGESATLALTALTSGDVTLELYDGSSNRLAMGMTAANLSQVINNFVDTTADSGPDAYFARVSGSMETEYSLLITRNADFDTEPNDRPADVQDIVPSRVVLGNLSFVEQQKLTASDAADGDRFGTSPSISGDTLIVGAYGDDDAGPYSGAVYVFHLDGNRWVEQQKLAASDADSGQRFGHSVSISGDKAIVGAYLDDDAGSGSGSAYIFRFDGSQWVQQQKLTASDANSDDWFGYCVSIDGETAIVGTPYDDDGGMRSGSAYVFHFDGSQWLEQEKLTASDAADGDLFGNSVSIDGDTAIVGARGNDDAAENSGSAYVFRFDGSQWVEQQKLTASDAGQFDYFGCSVSVDGHTAIVGAYYNRDVGSSSGSAYVFRFDGSQWVEQQKLTASDAAEDDYFGISVSIDGDTAVVGAFGDDDAGSDSGSVYVFRCDGNQWIEQDKLIGADSAARDEFGRSVAIGGDSILVGATTSYYEHGAAYVFTADRDDFAVSVEGGQTLVVETATPGDGPGEFVNELDPAVELYDPNGMLLAADDNGAADGRNAWLVYPAAVEGTYTVRVRVRAAGGSSGEYVLSVLRQPCAVVAGRHVFYNNSAFDENNLAPTAEDDEAIASDKVALLPGGTTAFANYTSYSRGINGIMIDVANLAGTPTAEDFEFKVGNDNDPAGWTPVDAAPTIAVREGAGAHGSDRVTIIWPDNVIQKRWLQVTVLPGGNIGLDEADVFYFGNAIGESGNSTADAKVNAYDMLGARDNQRTFVNPAAIDFNYDYNRDRRVNAYDMLIARDNQTHFLNALELITVPQRKAAAKPLADDAVSQRAAGRESGLRRAAFSEWAWLYEFEPGRARDRAFRKSDPAKEALDELLAAWP